MLERSSWTDNFIWIILFLLLVPSGLVVASWNSLPGSHLYKVKIAMEQAVLALAPTYMAKGELQVAYTERRFSEADQLLTDDQSAEGLAIFKEQALAAQQALQQAPPGEARRQLANKYIASLQSASTKLEQQKQIIGGRSRPANTASSAPSNSNPQQPNIIVVTQVVQVTQVTQVIQQINQTQTQINTIINSVQNTGNQTDSATISPTPIPTEVPTATPAPTPIPTPEPTAVPTQPGPQFQADFAAPPNTPTDTVAPITDTPAPTQPPSGNNGNGGDNGNGNH